MRKFLHGASLGLALSAVIVAFYAFGITAGKQWLVEISPALAAPPPITQFVGVSPYPPNAIPISNGSGNVANAAAIATLAGAPNLTTYLAGFSCQNLGATAASVVQISITGLTGGTLIYEFIFPTIPTIINTPPSAFIPPIPASAPNTPIVVTMPAGGAGNLNASCNAWGYQL